jgi:hypothetical protein
VRNPCAKGNCWKRRASQRSRSLHGSLPHLMGKPFLWRAITLLMNMKHEATDRFMRDSIRGCYCTERFLLLHHTMNDHRPVFSGKTGVRVFWPWSPFANKRRRAGVLCFIVSEQVLYLEIECANRGKEAGENW